MSRTARSGWVQLWAVVRKETLQTIRDRRIMVLLIVAPLVQTLLFGVAVDFQVDRVPTAVVDMDGSVEARDHVRRLLADGTLRGVEETHDAEEAQSLLDRDRVAAVLVLPRGFGADQNRGDTARAQMVIDGSDPTRSGASASAAGRYFGSTGQALARERASSAGRSLPGSVEVVPRVFYNPSLRTPVYMVPGILAMLLVIVTTIVTAMGLAREREVGTLEQVMVTPIRPLMLLAGKMIPFVVIGLFDVLLVLTAATWIFDVPMRGPFWVLAVGTLFYLGCTLGVGLLVSTVSTTQQQSFLGGFLFVLPAALLSGIMTPVRAMPMALQIVTWFNPLRWFAELVRGVLLRGAGAADLWFQVLVLALFGVGILGVATLRFRRAGQK